MKPNIMKRALLIVAMAFMLSATVMAQRGLAIDNVFRLYGHAKGCKMVELNDTKLRGYELKVYKSLMHKNLQPKIEPYLNADKNGAKKIREVVENGRVVSGYYMMTPASGGYNRYILFSNTRGNGGAIIYIEGELTPDDIMKLCYY